MVMENINNQVKGKDLLLKTSTKYHLLKMCVVMKMKNLQIL